MKTFPKLLAGLALLAVSTAAAEAQSAHLVRDINPLLPVNEVATVDPRRLAVLGHRVVFSGSEGRDERYNEGLWASDGTVPGTEQLANGAFEPVASLPALTFWAEQHTFSLWVSDGSRAGTFPLVEGLSVFVPVPAAPLGNLLYFQACQEGVSCGLWRSDGTTAGTRQILDSPRGLMARAGDRIFFTSGNELWRIERGREPVLVTSTTGIGELVVLGNRLFFTTRNQADELWVSDGTAAGTRRLLRVDTNGGMSDFFKEVDGRLAFLVFDKDGNEIWVSDGTVSGTRRVTNFDTGEESPFSFYFKESLQGVGGRLVFAAEGPDERLQLWSTDGRPESTAPLVDPCESWPSCELPSGRPLLQTVRVGDLILFTGYDEEHGRELWATDGTRSGTRLFRDLCPGSCSSLPDFLPSTQGEGVYFSARRSANEPAQLWWIGSTAAGPRQLTRSQQETGLIWDVRIPLAAATGGRIFLGLPVGGLWMVEGQELLQLTYPTRLSGGAGPGALLAHGGALYFVAKDGNEASLWRTTGSEESTSRIPGTAMDQYDSHQWGSPAAAGGSAFYRRSRELWGGTSSGMQLLASLSEDTLRSSALGNLLYFLNGAEIWRSDGTVQGTHRAFDLPADVEEIRGWTPANGRFYFQTNGVGLAGPRLWVSDGTPGGTRALAELPSSQFLSGYPAARLGGIDVLITIQNSSVRLWRTDGTAAGTRSLATEYLGEILGADQPVVLRDALYFFSRVGSLEGDDLSVLWRTDGTEAGTVRVRSFQNHPPSDHPASFDTKGLLATNGDLLFLIADDGEHGVEIWTSNGTAAGTRLLREFAPGRRSGTVYGPTAAGGRMFFGAADPAHGIEIWQSDGTAAGTRLVHDVAPGPKSSLPQQITAADGRLYFTADDGLVGRELWTLPLSSPAACQPSAKALCLQGGRFRAEVHWRDFQGNSGTGTAVPLTADTGYFWFFEPSNAEVILKVLDGRGLNGHHWVFYGALSSVEYSLTVTDTQTGLTQRYFNPPGNLASVGDTTGFGPQGAFVPRRDPLVASPSPLLLASARTEPAAATGSCQPGPRRLCVNGGRFAVEATWKDFEGNTGQGTAVPLTTDTGYFWFFDPANVEVMLKVLDGSALNGKFWIFYGALSNVEYTLTVTDTQTGAVKVYSNPGGRFASVADTGAF